MLDVAVVGAGPAGLSAAINVYARNKTVRVFGKNMTTSWLYKAERVDNHLGMPEMTGAEMLEAFYKHTRDLNIEISEGRILQILPMGDYFTLNFEDEFIEAARVILATGLTKGKSITGEDEFLGKGVSYCATCDGMLYKGRKVVVVNQLTESPEESEEDIKFLNSICEVDEIEPKRVKRIIGDDRVSGIETDEGVIKAAGVFVLKETMKPDRLIYGLELSGNSIVVNRNFETNIPGLYAAGDCIGAPFQLSKAIGEGLVAGQNAANSIKAKGKKDSKSE